MEIEYLKRNYSNTDYKAKERATNVLWHFMGNFTF
jgi:hypothetical protein